MKKVSLIIPCYNEEQALPIFAGELDKVRQELRQYDFEVLMVNDGSSDKTLETTKKLSTKKLKPLTYLKYAVLLVMVVLLPAFLVNDVGMGDPFFCKYLCPQGVLEGAIPLSLANSGIRAALGKLFTWKFSILLSVIVLSVVFYRPFCKWLCPLGAFYALFNRVSLFQMKVDENKCISCGKCARACKMDVDVTKTPNHTECIRCGMCVSACPTGAVSFRYGFGDGKQNINIEENTEEST